MISYDMCIISYFRGTDEHFGLEVDIINSTLGKAMGGAAGKRRFSWHLQKNGQTFAINAKLRKIYTLNFLKQSFSFVAV